MKALFARRSLPALISLRRIAVGIVFFLMSLSIFGSTSSDARSFGLKRLVNEVSVYQNRYDDFLNAGQTLQIVSINSLKLGTWFNLEFTYDLNYNLEKEDDFTYYLEVGVVKEILPRFSINYQRIHGSFMNDPVNQIGIRVSF